MSAGIATPRVDLSTQEGLIYEYLGHIDAMLLTYSSRTPFPHEISRGYVEHLDSSGDGLSALLSKGYGGDGKPFSEEAQQKFKADILSFKDDDLIRGSVTKGIGGKSRNPTGEFCEGAIEYLQGRVDHERCSLLLKVSDLFLVCANCRGSLKTYSSHAASEEVCYTKRVCTPEILAGEFQSLAQKFYPPEPSPLLETPPSSPSASSSARSSSLSEVPSLDFSAVVLSAPDILSPSIVGHFGLLVEGFLKDVLTALKALSEKLDEVQGRLIDRAIAVLPPDLKPLPRDLPGTNLKTQELFSQLHGRRLLLEEVRSLSLRVEVTTQDLMESEEWKMHDPDTLKGMSSEEREAALNNHAYSIEYLFKNFEISILSQLALSVLRPLQAEESDS